MSLSAWEQRALHSIENSLAGWLDDGSLVYSDANQDAIQQFTSRGRLSLQLAQPPDIRDHRQQAANSNNGRIPAA